MISIQHSHRINPTSAQRFSQKGVQPQFKRRCGLWGAVCTVNNFPLFSAQPCPNGKSGGVRPRRRPMWHPCCTSWHPCRTRWHPCLTRWHPCRTRWHPCHALGHPCPSRLTAALVGFHATLAGPHAAQAGFNATRCEPGSFTWVLYHHSSSASTHQQATATLASPCKMASV